MKKFFITITLFFLVGSLFAYPIKCNFTKVTEFDGDSYYWNWDANKCIEMDSEDWNFWMKEMKDLGYTSTSVKVIPLSDILENHTATIAEILLAKSYGCYNICIDHGDYSFTDYFIGKYNIVFITHVYNN